MPLTECPGCHSSFRWDWEEAFYKFGFGDGDGIVMTEAVANLLRESGYDVMTHRRGLHNTVIASIKHGDVELIPQDGIQFGYDDPRDYLPEAIISLLDGHFDEDAEVAA